VKLPSAPSTARCWTTSILRARAGFWSISPPGLDLSLGEFSEVGDTIEEFASDEATVVVGTVIDPD
jgi:cell division protein FtsZ